MSSTEQAFVKAFARRNRINDTPTETPSVPSTTEAVGDQQVADSVASTTSLGIDPIEEQVVRADIADPNIPKPHVDSATTQRHPAERSMTEIEQALASLQHIHTAYANAGALPSALSASLSQTATSIGPAPVVAPSIGPAPSTRPINPAPVARALPSQTATPVAKVAKSVSSKTIDSRAAAIAETAKQQAMPSSAASDVDSSPVADKPITSVPIDSTPSRSQTTQTRTDAPHPSIEAPRVLLPFQAAWEVDVFDVSTTVADLFFAGSLFQELSDRMSDAAASGLRSMLVTSTHAGEGRSTVAIGIAMAAAAAGVRVALVDADTADPTLADDLRLDLQQGWIDSIRGRLPIKEVAIHAIEDAVTLIPLMPAQGQHAATPAEVTQLVELLKDKFQLVIVDGPDSKSSDLRHFVSAIDSAIIVRDVSRTDIDTLKRFTEHLQSAGVQGIGLVENFVPDARPMRTDRDSV